METEIIKVDENNLEEGIEKGSKLIREGSLVSFPTETVYGLGADGLNAEAVKKIYKAKGRPEDNPLILHISEIDELEKLVRDIPNIAYILMENFWPGPLTLIFKRSELVPDIITAGLDTVAIRMPDNIIARKLIKSSKTPIAAPSANTSGRPSPTSANHVYEDLKGKIPLILNGGRTGVGLESTVLDLTSETPKILRPGGITEGDLLKYIKKVEIDKGLEDLNVIPKSPGQKYKHYAPKAEMFLYKGEERQVVKRILKDAKEKSSKGLKVGIIATDETVKDYEGELVYSLGSRKNLETIAYNLFNTLRDLDNEDVDIILSESVMGEDMARAIGNRMLKAAGGNIIEV